MSLARTILDVAVVAFIVFLAAPGVFLLGMFWIELWDDFGPGGRQ